MLEANFVLTIARADSRSGRCLLLLGPLHIDDPRLRLRVLYVPLHAALTPPTAAAAERPPLALLLPATGEAEQPSLIAAALQHVAMQFAQVRAALGALGAHHLGKGGVACRIGGRITSRQIQVLVVLALIAGQVEVRAQDARMRGSLVILHLLERHLHKNIDASS